MGKFHSKPKNIEEVSEEQAISIEELLKKLREKQNNQKELVIYPEADELSYLANFSGGTETEINELIDLANFIVSHGGGKKIISISEDNLKSLKILLIKEKQFLQNIETNKNFNLDILPSENKKFIQMLLRR